VSLYYNVPKSQRHWLNLLHSPTLPLPPVTGRTPSGQIPGDEPEQSIDGFGGKDFETRHKRQCKSLA